jgi:hypothetical protein
MPSENHVMDSPSAYRAELQASHAGTIAWSKNTGPASRAHTLEGRCGQLCVFFSMSLWLRESQKKFVWWGGGLFFFAPKSFVGKHFIGQLQLHPFSVAKQGRWVYEGSELKAFRIPTKYFSINFIVLSLGLGCLQCISLWVGAGYSV